MGETDRPWEVNICVLLYFLVPPPDELEAEHERPPRRVCAGHEDETNRALRVPELVRAAPPVHNVVRRAVVRILWPRVAPRRMILLSRPCPVARTLLDRKFRARPEEDSNILYQFSGRALKLYCARRCWVAWYRL